MAIKRNRWLVAGVLIVAVLGFAALSLLPILSNRQPNNNPATASTPGYDAKAELETRAKGYELVLEREPDNQTALRGLVEARAQMGDMAGVIEPLEKLAELNPDVVDYRILLGQTKQKAGDLEGAAQAYRTILTTYPGNINALQALVGLLLDQKRPQAAVGLLQDTLKAAKSPTNAQAGTIDVTSVQLLLGQVYAEEGKLDQAIKVYDEAIATAGQDFRPLLAKALVLQKQGKLDEAKPLFDQAKALAPDVYQDQIQALATGAAGSTPDTGAVTPPVPETAPADSPTTAPAPGE